MDGQTSQQTNGWKEGQAVRRIYQWTVGLMDKQTDGWTDRGTVVQMDRQTNGWTDIPDVRTDGQTFGQTELTDRRMNLTELIELTDRLDGYTDGQT